MGFVLWFQCSACQFTEMMLLKPETTKSLWMEFHQKRRNKVVHDYFKHIKNSNMIYYIALSSQALPSSGQTAKLI